jgi:hypothetical protein
MSSQIFQACLFKTYHVPLLVYFHELFLAPDVSDPGCFTGGFGYFRFSAITTVRRRTARKRNKALHGPLSRHRDAAVCAPHGPRCWPLTARLGIQAIFTHPARVAHSDAPALPFIHFRDLRAELSYCIQNKET